MANDINLYVEDSGGAGRPVVLIHGWPMSGEAWSAQVPALREAGYRVITYDRRGFGRSDKPETGYDYDTLADDLAGVMDDLDLREATLVGFSMGGGEVARYVSRHGQDRLGGVVFAAAVPPYILKTEDNPEGPMPESAVREMEENFKKAGADFYDGFTRAFFSVGDTLKVTEAQRQEAIALCQQADLNAALHCIGAFSRTDFRKDLARITCPTLILHGDSDSIVPIEHSGQRTHAAIAGSKIAVLKGAPHGCNVSHAEAFNAALLSFLNDQG